MLILGILIAGTTAPVANYFPLKPGTEWTYKVSFYRNLETATQVNKVLDQRELKGVTVTPMQVQVDKSDTQTVFYGAKGEFISILAQSETELLPSPIPVLPLDPQKKKSFEFVGAVEFLGGLTPSTTKTKVNGLVKTTVLGQEKMALKVTRETKLGGDKTKIEIKSTELYVDGMGLVFQRQETVGKDGGWAEYLLSDFKDGAH
ncbi:MAG: hypothetical protein U0R49_11145 [Fimbriimonadales bacterium]